jgi:hypothetical protein
MLFIVVGVGIITFCSVRCEPNKKLSNIFSALVLSSVFILILLCVLDIVR